MFPLGPGPSVTALRSSLGTSVILVSTNPLHYDYYSSASLHMGAPNNKIHHPSLVSLVPFHEFIPRPSMNS